MIIYRKFISWYFGRDSLPYWCILVADCIGLLFFFFVGYYCVLGPMGVMDYFWVKLGLLCLCLIPYLVSYRFFHTYRNVVRYSSFVDLKNILLANALGSSVILLVRIIFCDHYNNLFPGLRVVLFTYALSSLYMCGWRVIVKAVFDITNTQLDAKRTFIYGTRESSVAVARSISNQKSSGFHVLGFISPTKDPNHSFLAGMPVYWEGINLLDILRKDHIQAVMVAPQQAEEFRNNDKLVTFLTHAGIQIFMVPEAQCWDGKSALRQGMLREVDIEDLLPREKIEVDMQAIGDMLRDKVILVTGAAGSIGSEMVRQIASFSPAHMVLIDQAETPMHSLRLDMCRLWPKVKTETIVTSITNQVRMESIFAQYKPEFVFHAAAYKHVPMMEDNPSEAVHNNVYGTKIIADLAVKYGAKKFVMISTDKAVNPTNVMGCSKRICEMYCQSLNKEQDVCQFVTTRFGNVLGSNGSVIPLFKEQIRRGGPVTVTHPDIIRFFMLIPEACKLVLEAGVFGKGGEIFVFDMGKPVRIADMAKRMIALSGATDVSIEYTGLRAGEKLYEEVLSTAEPTKPTIHPQIFIAEVREYSYKSVNEQVEKLYQLSFSTDDMAIVKCMKEMVPEYHSQHSKYQVLDQK